MLYEASRTDAGELPLPLRPPLRALRAHVYAQSELCDLARADATALEEVSAEEAELRRLLVAIGRSELSADQGRATDASFRALAHGATARCYFGGDEPEEGREELEAFVAAAERAGATSEDLALLRAYLRYAAGDLRAAREQLELAKRAEWTDEDLRTDVDELIGHLDRDETGFLDEYFDKAFVASLSMRIVLRTLEESGVFDAAAELEAVKKVRAFLEVVGVALTGTHAIANEAGAKAADAVESVGDRTKALWEQVRGSD